MNSLPKSVNTFVMDYIYQNRTRDTVVGIFDFSQTTIGKLIDLVVVLITELGNTYLFSKKSRHN